MLGFLAMRYNEKKGHWPLMKANPTSNDDASNESGSEDGVDVAYPEKDVEVGRISTTVRRVEPASPVGTT